MQQWSYGVLLWELLTRGSTPYPDLDYMDIKAHLKLGKRLARPDFAPDEMQVIFYYVGLQLSLTVEALNYFILLLSLSLSVCVFVSDVHLF